MLRKINDDQKITVIVNIHVLSLAKKYAKRMIAFRKGEVVFDGPPSELTEEKIDAIYHVDQKALDQL
jgi:phosphonate transport system ATP-binding protein